MATGLWDRANLFGTLGGLRPALADRGITFGLAESSEVFGNRGGPGRPGVLPGPGRPYGRGSRDGPRHAGARARRPTTPPYQTIGSRGAASARCARLVSCHSCTGMNRGARKR